MALVRKLVGMLIVALVIVTGANSVAMASSEIEHQKHCVDAVDAQIQDMGLHDTNAHDHGDTSSRHAMPGHDHETCMLHACQALSPEMSAAQEPHHVLLMTLIWPENSLNDPVHKDDLQRPPRS